MVSCLNVGPRDQDRRERSGTVERSDAGPKGEAQGCAEYKLRPQLRERYIPVPLLLYPLLSGMNLDGRRPPKGEPQGCGESK